MTIWEIFNDGDQPWSGLSNFEVAEAVKGGVEKMKPGKCPEYIYHIALQCWKKDPNDRPDFGTILNELAKNSPISQSDGNENYMKSPISEHQHHYSLPETPNEYSYVPK